MFALITFVKKSNQCFHIIILGTDRYGVYTAFLERIAHLRLTFLPPFLIGRAHTGGGTVYPLLLPGLGVLDLHKAYGGKLGLTTVVHLNGYHVMRAVGHRQCVLETLLIDKIGNEESRATLLDGVGQVFQHLADIRSRLLGMEIDQLPDDI